MRHRTRLGLSKYTAQAVEQAADTGGDLRLARNVRDVAAIHSTLWPAETGSESFEVGLLIGRIDTFNDSGTEQSAQVIDVEPGE
jgi:hypothetical protein